MQTMVWEKAKFEEIVAQPQVWLALSPQKMLEYCEDYNITAEQGCRIILRHYQQDEIAVWCYNYSFGVLRQ